MELMLADEGAVPDAPEALTDAQSWQELLLGAGQAEGAGGHAELVGFLPVDNPGLRICQETVGEGSHGGALVADVFQVGEFVEDQHVGDPVVADEPPVRIHPLEQSRV